MIGRAWRWWSDRRKHYIVSLSVKFMPLLCVACNLFDEPRFFLCLQQEQWFIWRRAGEGCCCCCCCCWAQFCGHYDISYRQHMVFQGHINNGNGSKKAFLSLLLCAREVFFPFGREERKARWKKITLIGRDFFRIGISVFINTMKQTLLL